MQGEGKLDARRHTRCARRANTQPRPRPAVQGRAILASPHPSLRRKKPPKARRLASLPFVPVSLHGREPGEVAHLLKDEQRDARVRPEADARRRPALPEREHALGAHRLAEAVGHAPVARAAAGRGVDRLVPVLCCLWWWGPRTGAERRGVLTWRRKHAVPCSSASPCTPLPPCEPPLPPEIHPLSHM